MPEKNWKFSATDAKERGFWDDYMKAYEETIRETATEDSPWYVVPADQQVVHPRGRRRGGHRRPGFSRSEYPEVSAAKREELVAARAALLGT